MDSELLKSSLSDNTMGSERNIRSASPFYYTETFNKHFPYYLSIGMTYKQYWEEDCILVKYYREADKLKRESANQAAWLQGMYFYDALIRVSPVLAAFAPKGTKPIAYMNEPYPISKNDIVEAERKQAEREKAEIKAKMEAFVVSNNKRFEKGSE